MDILNEKLSAKHRAARDDIFKVIQENNEILIKLAKIYYRITGKDLDYDLFKNGKLKKDAYPSDGILPAQKAIQNWSMASSYTYSDKERRNVLSKPLLPSFHDTFIDLSFNISSYSSYDHGSPTVYDAYRYLKNIQPEIKALKKAKEEGNMEYPSSYINNTKGHLDGRSDPNFRRNVIAKAHQLKDYAYEFKRDKIKEKDDDIDEEIIYNKYFNY